MGEHEIFKTTENAFGKIVSYRLQMFLLFVFFPFISHTTCIRVFFSSSFTLHMGY
jgi:hypothetical protein